MLRSLIKVMLRRYGGYYGRHFEGEGDLRSVNEGAKFRVLGYSVKLNKREGEAWYATVRDGTKRQVMEVKGISTDRLGQDTSKAKKKVRRALQTRIDWQERIIVENRLAGKGYVQRDGYGVDYDGDGRFVG